MKFVILSAVFIIAAVAMPIPQDPSVLTAGDPNNLNIPHDPVVIEAINQTSNGAPLFKQCDGRWSGNRLGTCSLTICQAGCAMSSVAMMLDAHGLSLDPASLNNWLEGNGGYVSGCDIVWSDVDKFGKTHFQGIETASESAICSGISAGHGIIANVNGGHHWVLLTGCRGGGVFDVHDPGFNRATYSMSDILREAVYH